MIGVLREEHVPEVALLHCATVSSLLQRLGGKAAQAYYRGAIRSGLAVGFVDVDDGLVIGFVLGSVHPDQLKRGIVRVNRAEVLGGIIVGILSRPSLLKWLLRSFRRPEHRGYDPRAPELIYLATSPSRRGSGIGRRLVDAFSNAVKEQGANACELSVDEDNGPAIAFYERLGFRMTNSYREFGTMHRRYRLSLTPVEAAPPGVPR